MKALWLELVRLGGAASAGLPALNEAVRHETGVDHVHWLTPELAARVAASLKARLDRVQGPRRRRA